MRIAESHPKLIAEYCYNTLPAKVIRGSIQAQKKLFMRSGSISICAILLDHRKAICCIQLGILANLAPDTITECFQGSKQECQVTI